MKKVIIFDYDGVIVDSLDVFMENFIFACKKEGWDKIANKKDFLRLFNGNMYESMLNMGMTKEKISRIVNVLRDGLLKNQDKIKVFDGVIDTIKKLSNVNILVIVTSNQTVVVEHFLKRKNIEYFKEILGSDKGFRKVKKIIMIKSRYPDLKCYYIGDTKGDILEGKNAGISTIAVTWGWHGENELIKEKPEYIVDTPGELLKFLL